jgi:2-polyprenyl-3-methyl-5-hydroxy-6-metoxy-1,4-benzoquinol methylase
MKEYEYQDNFSSMHPDVMYDYAARQKKANKILSVLKDYLGESGESLCLLDVGCSAGIMTSELSKIFKSSLGIDIDETAVQYASKWFSSETLNFAIQDSMNMALEDNSFNVVVCNHVYEHVPDANLLFAEIYRVLKPNGICYFAAGNRLDIKEHHHNLPFLSIVPKFVAHVYLRVMKKGKYYYETHYSYWGLKRLVAQFEVVDYTEIIIKNPERFHADDMVKTGSVTQKFALFLAKIGYWFFPTYIWVLKKGV